MIPRKYLIGGVVALLVLFIIFQALFSWPAETQISDKQQKLITSIEERKWGRVRKLLADDYSDTLGLDRETLLLALKDAGSQFWTEFDLNWEPLEQRREGDVFIVTGNIRIQGKGGPFATDVVIAARPFSKDPVTFRWKKVGMAPWKWRLESISHPKAKLPPGYTPGDVRRRTGLGQF